MSRKQQKRDVPAPGAGGSGFIKHEQTLGLPPVTSKEAKQVAKKVIRALEGGGTPNAPMLTHNDMQAYFKKEITAFAKQYRGERIPQVVKNYIRCLIEPAQGTACRIPDGKSRASVVAATYNIFPVVGNWAGGTDDADKGRFFWSFSPTPLNLLYSAIFHQVTPMLWPTPGGTQATGFFSSRYLQGAFALTMDPAIGWDPTQALIETPAFFEGSSTEMSEKDDHLIPFRRVSEELAQHVRKNPKLRAHSVSQVQQHFQSEQTITKARSMLNSSKLTPKERDQYIMKYADAQRMQARILSNPNTNAGYIYYQDQDTPFLAGTGSTTYNNTTDGTVEFQTGTAKTIRSVAQSVWFECTTTEFADGGTVAITYLPADSLIGNVIPGNPGGNGTQTWSAKGPLQNYEKHAGLPLQNNGSNREPATTYMGKFKDGAFAYWTPESDSDYDFKPIVEHASTPQAMILVAGQNQGNGTDPGVIAQIHVHTVYEYQTDEPDVDAKASPQVPGGLDWVAGVMRQFPQAMSNDSHVKWWQYVLKAIGAGTIGFLTGGPVGAAIGAGGVLAATEISKK